MSTAYSSMAPSRSSYPVVLIVDDEVDIVLVLRRWLEREGYTCRSCASGEEALSILEREDIGIVVTDWHILGLDGIELTRSIRARHQRGKPYIVLTTGDTSMAVVQKAFEAGVDDFIRKPMEGAEIISRFNAACRVLDLEERLAHDARVEAERGLHRGVVRELSEVVATLAHDLRTPLGTMRMTARSMRIRVDKISPELETLADRMERISAQMSETLDDVLAAFVQDDGSSEAWTDFDLAQEARRAVEMLAVAIPESVRVEVEQTEFPMRGNPFGMRRLILNLMNNALRHAKPSRLDVTFHVEDQGDWGWLEIQDNGEGIDPGLLPHLGEPLRLTSSSVRKEFFVRGNGLGLTICRRICASHGGRMVIASGKERGTRIRVWFRLFESAPVRDSEFAPLETEVLV
ncbi:MAG: hybrid sensor histidine kinase/response regulator [Fibrobacterota bacterium]|nr:hybrid sensor histidine kinase/response regulator [Fibrobacterota bacterium]QQS03911.1 MAG: hybrid sensor histidine kinase/response regulator [Fibrobacterota bacterium]